MPTPVAPTPAPPVQPQPVQPAPEPPPPRELSERELMARANYEPSTVRLGGFLQTQYRWREDSDAAGVNDTNGFRMARARLVGQGETRAGNLELSFFTELELQPIFDLNDAFATVSRPLPNHARITVDGGQMRVPVSRQNMLSDTRLSFVDKAQIATISPLRDLGMKVTIDLPRPDKRRRRDFRMPGVRFIGGVFNGEGTNQVENINQRYMWTGRLEVTAFGIDNLTEGAFGGKYLTISTSAAYNNRNEANRLDTVTWVGFDIAGSYKGLSGSFEYLEARHVQTVAGMDDPNTQDFKQNGFTAQLAYLLPVRVAPYKQGRIELALRLEEIDRNDAVPISVPGDPAQSVRAVTAVASYYLRMHTLKAQLAFTSFRELEDRTATGQNAVFNNDQVLLQVTYRLE